jgi:hypothetical protein
MAKELILFDEESQNKLFEVMGKTIDSHDFIVEKSDPSQRVLTKGGEEVKREEFAGVKTGSEEFIKNDLPSLLELADSSEL